jgi:putative salt-induced outer membrane protein YdiY
MVLSLLPALGAAQQTLSRRNGDRLSGSLVTVDDGTWVFKYGGADVSIPATDIAGFDAAGPIGVRLVDGTIAAVSIATVGGQLRLTDPDGTVRSVAATDVAAVGDPTALEALVPVHIGYFTPIDRFWGATASVGFSDKSGNSRSRGLGAAVEFGRTSPKDRLMFKAGLAREQAPDTAGAFQTTVAKYFGSVRIDVFFSKRLFAFGFTGHERDQFQDIDLRSNYKAGFGYQVIATPLTDLRFSASGGVRYENFTADGSTSTPIMALGATWLQKLGPVAFAWDVDWAPSVEDFADYRFVSEASLTTAIYKGLGFRLASRNEFNNNPRPGIEKHDMLLTTTLTYTVGR